MAQQCVEKFDNMYQNTLNYSIFDLVMFPPETYPKEIIMDVN